MLNLFITPQNWAYIRKEKENAISLFYSNFRGLKKENISKFILA